MTADLYELPYIPLTDDGAAVLDAVYQFLGRFVAFPSEDTHVAVALWAAHCHAVGVFESTPRLALLSPEPGSGKTRTLEVLELLTPRPMHSMNASVPVLFRAVDKRQPTLLLDEVDAIFGHRSKDDNQDLRALLNAGHAKGATVWRCDGPNHDEKEFRVYAACAMAGLGDLPDTLMSRSVIVRMRRRAPSEKVQPFRRRLHEPEGHEIRERLVTWVAQVADAAGDAYPVMPPGVEDRPADVWEPLLAVADAAGGDWPARARAACTKLVKVAASGEASLGVRLLGDLRTVFGDIDAMNTETVLDALHKLDEAPWSDLRGKPLDARRLARFLGNYEVGSVKVKVDGRALQGYRREHLYDAWTRYLPPPPQEAEPPEPPEPRRSQARFEVPDSIEVPEPEVRTEPPNPSLTSKVPQVPEVPAIRGAESAMACECCRLSLDPALAALGERIHASCEETTR